MLRSPLRPWVLLCMSLSCGGDDPAPPAKAAPPPQKFDPLPVDPVPVAATDANDDGAEASTGDPFHDPEAEGGAADDAATSGAAAEGGVAEGGVAEGGVAEGGAAEGGAVPLPPAPAHPGPCLVNWKNGPRLRFDYRDGGGKTRIDGDADGKPEICADFSTADGRTTKVDIDEGCDKSVESTIDPTWPKEGNVGTARWIDESGTARDITLIAMPSFSGVAPGFPILAAKKDVKLKLAKGLVKTATVKKPHEGPPIKIDFTYDDAGRITRIKEDLENDGTVDRRFDLRYDASGNVTLVTLTTIDEGGETKITARPSYKCWS